MTADNSIVFPGLGISVDPSRTAFEIFGFSVYWYGVIIGIGFILGLLYALSRVKWEKIKEDDFLLVLIISLPVSVICARAYYVIFYSSLYFTDGKFDFMRAISIRDGGLAIYGGVIGAFLCAFIICRIKKISFLKVSDCVAVSFLIGQGIGRWGNFFNREAFGAFTKSFIRMAIPVDYFANEETLNDYLESGIITNKMLMNPDIVGKRTACISVYPTFLLEGLWCLALLIIILLYRRHKKFDGELSLFYIMGYGLGRFFIEGLRTDSLMIGSMKVSQIVALVCFFGAMLLLVFNYVRIFRGHKPQCHRIMKLSEDREIRAAEKTKKNTEKSNKVDEKSSEKNDSDEKSDNKVAGEKPEENSDDKNNRNGKKNSGKK